MTVRASYPAAYLGNYLGNNFSEAKRYMNLLHQQGRGIWNVDMNELMDVDLTRTRRLAIDLYGFKTAIGDAFKCVGTGAANDFTVKGGGGTLATALRFYLQGYPCLIVSDTTYSGQNAALNDSLATAPAALSAPGAPRTDEVYLDVSLKEVDGVSDAPLIPPTLVDSVTRRLRLITEVKVAVGPSTTPADFVDGGGVQHYTVKLATLSRFAAQAAINAPDLVDARTVALSGAVTGGGALGLSVSRDEIDMLRPQAQTVPDNTARVLAGVYTKNDNSGFRSVAAQNSPVFPVIGLAGNVRYDLLYIDNAGALARIAGTEILLAGSDPYVDGPAADNAAIAVAIAIIRVTETATVVVDTADVTDVREFFNRASSVGLSTIANGLGFSMINGTLVTSVAANALTVAIKTMAGANPSASDPVYVLFRNTTVATGDYTVIALTAATSFVVSSGSTLGASNATAFRIWLVAVNDAGTLRLGAINALSGANIYPLGQFPIVTTVAEGGAGAADSAHVVYTGTAASAKPYAILGYASWETGLTTAGTWDATPTRLHLHKGGDPLPGDKIQRQGNSTGAVFTGTTAIPKDDTIPQITEGDQYMTQAITPSSASNLLRVMAQLLSRPSIDDRANVLALFRDATANALAVATHTFEGSNAGASDGANIDHTVLAGSVASTTFRLRAGMPTGATTTVNGEAGGRLYGGVYNSYLNVEEVMA